jgi:hypothetical protein
MELMMPDQVQRAREDLTSEDHRLRVQALYILCRADDRGSLPQIISMLRDPDYRVRAQALQTVGELGAREAIGSVLDQLHDKETGVRIAAVTALGAFRESSTLDALIACLSDRNNRVRNQAVLALLSLGDQRARDPLVQALRRDPSPILHQEIARKLLDFSSSEVVDALIEALQSHDDDVRAKAAQMLGIIGDPRAIPALEYMAANDGGEYWEEHGVLSNSVAAEAAIDAIFTQQRADLSAAMEGAASPPVRWRHRMKDYTDCRKTFTDSRKDEDEQTSKTDGAETLVARIMLHFFGRVSSAHAVITAEWRHSHARHDGVLEDPVPIMHIPWDAWGALPHCGDLLLRMGQATGPAMQPDQFIELLRQNGFEEW